MTKKNKQTIKKSGDRYSENSEANNFARRRKQFIDKMPANSVAFILSNPERIRSNDTEYPYRQSSDVLYLSGFPEPESVLVLTNIKAEAQYKMIVRPKNRLQEIWTGFRFGVEGAIKDFDCDEAYTIDQFADLARSLLTKADNVYYKFGQNLELDKIFGPEWQRYSVTLHDPSIIVHAMRIVKDKVEHELMRRAAEISAEAHCVAMEVCRPGMMEYEVQAEMERIFRMRGSSGTAYNSIVAGGLNAICLHYGENKDHLKNGDLLLIDAACEYKGYASDITRTFPVNGKFSEVQLEIYNLVLAANKAAIEFAKPGVSLRAVHDKAANVLRKGLVKLGVLSPEMATSEGEEKAIKNHKGKQKPVVLRDLFMHGTSHWLGLDVHDVGTIGTRSTYLKAQPLRPGMAFTVEPGLYFNPDDKRLPKKYRGIGVRIEDDVIITNKGCDVLSADAPKDAKEIEELMTLAGND